jgi:hypothetical protein
LYARVSATFQASEKMKMKESKETKGSLGQSTPFRSGGILDGTSSAASEP